MNLKFLIVGTLLWKSGDKWFEQKLDPEAYSRRSSTSELECFASQQWLQVVNYFCKMFHLGCLTGF